MTSHIDPVQARSALRDLPPEAEHGDPIHIQKIYIPSSHLKALHPDVALVTGMRGAGKTFWWKALQNPDVHALVRQARRGYIPITSLETRAGFGVRLEPDQYPDKNTLGQLLRVGMEPGNIWRTVQTWRLAPSDHPVRRENSWKDRIDYVEREPEAISRLFHERDMEFEKQGKWFLLLFDALDRCSDDWQDMYRLIRGLMQTALDMRSSRRIRAKIFLRNDQIEETRIANFPDASKILASSVELSWLASELYGLLWHILANGKHGTEFRRFFSETNWESAQINQVEIFFQSRGAFLQATDNETNFTNCPDLSWA